MLHFESTDAFFGFVDYVVNLSEDERKRVEESLGFTSMQSYVEELERAYGEEPMLASLYPSVLPKRTFSRYYVRTTNSEFNNRKTTTFKTVEFMSGDWSDNLRVISNYVFPNL